MRRTAGNVFIEHRGKAEVIAVVVLIGVFLLVTEDNQFKETLSDPRRGQLYASLAGTTGALLGFTLAALSILVALPSSERLDILREHHSWPRVTSSYFRAAASLGLALILSTAGIPLDSAEKPWILYETGIVAVLTFAVLQAVAALVALRQVIAVTRQKKRVGPELPNDP